MNINDEIRMLAKEKDAVILAHNYQIPEIQDIADLCGDSLELARVAASTKAQTIILCGVYFMAESAAILAPDKTVIIPDPTAGCGLADMATPEKVLEIKRAHPEAQVVTYINSNASVKAVSDVICTSSNALKIVERLETDTVIFIPDRNLGHFVQRNTNKKIILWDGYCPVHENLSTDELKVLKDKHPDALVMVHPECPPQIIDMADEAFSTGQMVNFVKTTSAKKIIVGTEVDMIHKLRSIKPDIEYIRIDSLICHDMKKITKEKLLAALKTGRTRVCVDEAVSQASKRALERMLKLSE